MLVGSGLAALTYEVAWQKLLAVVVGISTYATTTVLACLMGGMALGSLWFGGIADRTRRPLRLFALLECGVAAGALLMLWALPWGESLYVQAPEWMHRVGWGSMALRIALVAPLVLVPAVMMGATLPVMARAARGDLAGASRRLGVLYGANTAGAVAGTALAGYVILPAIGVRSTIMLAAGINLALAVISGLRSLSPSFEDEPQATADAVTAEEPAARAEARRVARVAVVAAGVGGACALGLEVAWTRLLSFHIEANVYAFPTMLATFLAGTALGSLLLAAVGRRAGLATLGLLYLLAGVATLASAYQATLLATVIGRFYDAEGLTFLAGVAAGFSAAFALMGLPTLLFGAAFPLAARLATPLSEQLGQRVGWAAAASTAGSVAGAVLVGFMIIPSPSLGTTAALLIGAAALCALGLATLLTASRPGLPARLALAVCGLGLTVGVGVGLVDWRRPLPLHALVFGDLDHGSELLFYGESVGGTVTVIKEPPHPFSGRRSIVIQVDGVGVAGDSPMLRVTQRLQAHLPALLLRSGPGARDPRRVFILGLGTGEVSANTLLHGEVEVDCLELVHGEREANVLFHDINRRVLEHPRFNLIFDDARHHLLTTRSRYDLILSDSVHPARTWNTYTQDYYALARERLAPDGVFSTWVPIYQLDGANLRMVIATMREVFPHVAVCFAPHHYSKHAVLLGSNIPWKIDVDALGRELASNEAVRESLASLDIKDVASLLATLVCDERALDEVLEPGLALNTDDSLRLAYDLPRMSLIGERTTASCLALLRKLERPIAPLLHGRSKPEVLAALRQRVELRTLQFEALAAWFDGVPEKAIAPLSQALQRWPEDETTQVLLARARFSAAMGLAAAARAAADQAPDPAAAAGPLARAEQALQAAVAAAPRSAPAWHQLGEVRFLRRRADAVEAYRRALTIVPGSIPSRFNLAITLKALGRLREARFELDELRRFHPDRPEVAELAALLAK